MIDKRPFNLKAYNAFDLKNKQELVAIMTKKGYTLVGELNKEHYKKFDVKFIKGDKEVSFENETRVNFVTIRDVYKTIHIPIRKKDSQADYYVVWKPELDEFFLIDKDVINANKEKLVTLVCNEFEEENIYEDTFIDIPKDEAVLYRKKNGKWLIVKK